MSYTKIELRGVGYWDWWTCVIQVDLELRRFASRRGRLIECVNDDLSPYWPLQMSTCIEERMAFERVYETILQRRHAQWEKNIYRGNVPSQSANWLLENANGKRIKGKEESWDFWGLYDGPWYSLLVFGDDVQLIRRSATPDRNKNAPIRNRIAWELLRYAR